jgi:integrase/recombinase XerD
MMHEVEAFKDYLLSEKGVSSNTIEAYSQDLKSFFLWMETKSKSISSITRRDISDFLMDYKNRGKGHAVSSISRMLATLKIFFRYLLGEGYIREDPSYLIQFPKGWNRLPHVLSIKEIKNLLETPSLKGR